MKKGTTERLLEAAELFEAGHLTEQEFQTLKQTILGEASESKPNRPPRTEEPQKPLYDPQQKQQPIPVDRLKAEGEVSRGNTIGCILGLLAVIALGVKFLRVIREFQ